MKKAFLLLVLVGCKHIEPIEPVFSDVPPSRVIVEVEEPIPFQLSYPPEEPIKTEVFYVSNGWSVLTGMPQVENYDEVSNQWWKEGVLSYYSNNNFYCHDRPDYVGP